MKGIIFTELMGFVEEVGGIENLEGVVLDLRDNPIRFLPAALLDALPALQREEVDLVVSSDPEDMEGTDFTALFDYEPVFVASAQNALAKKDFVVAEDFRDQLRNALVLMQCANRGDDIGHIPDGVDTAAVPDGRITLIFDDGLLDRGLQIDDFFW